jgi:4-diphosphocytidyl-2-C-methyl-D-erythritol kinase
VTEALRGAAGAQVDAQAKINLRLRILAREASGYHQLETLFLRLALADTVRVRRSASRSLDVSGIAPGASLGSVEQNLAWRAAVAYADASEWRDGFAIELEKRIPVGGGLGGGSADAGAVLRIMEALSEAPLGDAALMGIAARLGADVPFLASEHAYALAWGRGERMLALAPPEVRGVMLLVPPFGVNTAEAYGWLAEARRGERGASIAEPALGVASLSRWEAIAAFAVNDFEPVVAARHPEIGEILHHFGALGLVPTLMSGSGSSVFAIVPPDVDTLGADPGLGGRLLRTFTAEKVEPVRWLD